MKESKPEGMPDAQKAARERLSVLYTGKKDATEEEILKGVEEQAKSSKSEDRELKKSVVNVERFLDGLGRALQRWRAELISISLMDKSDESFALARGRARGLMSEIEHVESLCEEWRMFVYSSIGRDQALFRQLHFQLTNVKNSVHALLEQEHG